MIWQYQLFMILMPFAGAAILVCILTSWKWRFTPKGKYFVASQFCAFGFLIFNTLELVTTSPSLTIFFMKLSFVFLTLIPPIWLLFSLQYIGMPLHKISWSFFVIPIITIALTWANESLHWFWTGYEFIPIRGMLAIKTEYGFWFTINALYSHTILISVSVILLLYFSNFPKVFRNQTKLLFYGITLPVLWNFISILRIFPIHKDFSPIALAVPAITFTYSLIHYRLFDLAPVSRSSVLEHLQDGVVIIDSLYQILDINQTARQLLHLEETDPIGTELECLFPDWRTLKENGEFSKEHKYKMSLDGKPHQYTLTSSPHQEGMILVFRDVTETEKLIRDIQSLAALDSLTDLYNRRHFFELAERTFEQAVRYRRQLSVLLIDIDHFKLINDKHGHQKGDEVLCAISGFCKERLRKADVLARYGGDELILLLPETNLPQAYVLAERLRQESHKLPFTGKKGAFQITLSIGVSCLCIPEPAISLEALIDHADQALYQAKRDGRNQVAKWE
ncbi:MAG: diguanylate cyclase [Anaerolineaceae bacterium]|nr:diguanylate cyclase [Anaerolineaceae bacterium]